jgi:hypothetical protein
MEKWLICTLWHVRGIQSLIEVPKDMSYITPSFGDGTMPDLMTDMTLHGRVKTLKGFQIYINSAHPHNSRPSQGNVQALSSGCLDILMRQPRIAKT